MGWMKSYLDRTGCGIAYRVPKHNIVRMAVPPVPSYYCM